MADAEVTLDVAQPQDAAKVLAMLRLLQVESDTFTISPEFATLTVDAEAHNIEQIGQTTDNLILLAWLEDEPIGIVTVSMRPQTGLGELGVAVRKPYWHQGLGTALVDEALNWARYYSSLNGLFLEVLATNVHAIALYEKTGFVDTDQVQVKKDGHSLAARQMKIEF